MIKKLSVIIPVYNEGRTIYNLLQRVSQVKLDGGLSMELVVVNDCSRDNTSDEIQRFQTDFPQVELNQQSHPVNQGKGAALHTGIKMATGDLIVIQDADLEYDPNEFNKLLKPVLLGFADVVYGSRFKGGDPHRVLFFSHTIGNQMLTFVSNMFTNINLSDMETCYKMFKSEIIKGIRLKEKRFGFEPEVTAKISKNKNIRIYEVGISYYGRTYAEGKKISWKDGFRAIYCVLKYNIWSK